MAQQPQQQTATPVQQALDTFSVAALAAVSPEAVQLVAEERRLLAAERAREREQERAIRAQQAMTELQTQTQREISAEEQKGATTRAKLTEAGESARHAEQLAVDREALAAGERRHAETIAVQREEIESREAIAGSQSIAQLIQSTNEGLSRAGIAALGEADLFGGVMPGEVEAVIKNARKQGVDPQAAVTQFYQSRIDPKLSALKAMGVNPGAVSADLSRAISTVLAPLSQPVRDRIMANLSIPVDPAQGAIRKIGSGQELTPTESDALINSYAKEYAASALEGRNISAAEQTIFATAWEQEDAVGKERMLHAVIDQTIQEIGRVTGASADDLARLEEQLYTSAITSIDTGQAVSDIILPPDVTDKRQREINALKVQNRQLEKALTAGGPQALAAQRQIEANIRKIAEIEGAAKKQASGRAGDVPGLKRLLPRSFRD